MRLVLSNGYRHAADEVMLSSVGRNYEHNAGGIRSSMKVSWVISGFIQAASQSALTTALRLLELAYSADGFMAVFLDNSGRNTVHTLGDATSRGGCKVINFGYTMQSGAEYSTFRSYQISLEAEYDNVFAGVEEFTETITWKGNCGPRIVWKKNLNGAPQKQITYPQTTQRIVQRGTIIGKFSAITPPPPLWPQYFLPEEEELSDTSPLRFGPIGRPYYMRYARSYAYYFESPIPLLGQPNRWRQ
jgi:hypothetical protein